VQDELFLRARRRIGDLRPRGPLRPDADPSHFYAWWPDWVDRPTTTRSCRSSNASDIHVVVCGADSIPRAAVPWLGSPRRVRRDERIAAMTSRRTGPFELVDPRGELAHGEPVASQARPHRRHASHRFPRQRGEPADRSRLHGVHARAGGAVRERLGPITVHRDAKPVLSRPADRAMLDWYRDCRGVVSGLAK
jgi:hypothetical protein